MQKIEIVLSGQEAEPCAELIMALARETMKQFNVVPVRNYCGQNPSKRGYGELLVPEFMKCRMVVSGADDRQEAEHG